MGAHLDGAQGKRGGVCLLVIHQEVGGVLHGDTEIRVETSHMLNTPDFQRDSAICRGTSNAKWDPLQQTNRTMSKLI